MHCIAFLGPTISAPTSTSTTQLDVLRTVLAEFGLVEGRNIVIKGGWPLAAPAAWRQIACLASAQPIPTTAAQVSCDVGVMRHLLGGVSVAEEQAC
jgi:hypothetical protein